MVRAVDCGSKLLHSGTGFGSSYKRIFFRDFQKKFEWEEGFMRKSWERVCFISKYLCFLRFENINVLEALAKQRCVPIGKQNVFQWSASL